MLQLTKKFVIVIILVFLSLLSVACTSNKDKHEITDSIDHYPSFLLNRPKEIRDVYKLVADNYELLTWIPCYCNCGIEHDHKSVADCFYHNFQKSNQIEWVPHGADCGICMETAELAVQKAQDGDDIFKIREALDSYYGEFGFYPSANTPFPI